MKQKYQDMANSTKELKKIIGDDLTEVSGMYYNTKTNGTHTDRLSNRPVTSKRSRSKRRSRGAEAPKQPD